MGSHILNTTSSNLSESMGVLVSCAFNKRVKSFYDDLVERIQNWVDLQTQHELLRLRVVPLSLSPSSVVTVNKARILRSHSVFSRVTRDILDETGTTCSLWVTMVDRIVYICKLKNMN